ncbi:MAG: PolC-type DNA polymerase III [Bacilli bacterium]|nr:PolC-type DNA polymerase III [Bacilli bacterium]
MTDKILRFLTSIKIEDPERFDVDFDFIGYNPYTAVKTLDMVILKKSPWEYSLAEEFLMAVSTITYPYTLRFNYLESPTAKDAIALFDSWLLSVHHTVANYEVKEESESTVLFVFPDVESEKNGQAVIAEFKKFLDFFNYDVEVKGSVGLFKQPKEIKPIMEEKPGVAEASSQPVPEKEETVEESESNEKEETPVEEKKETGEEILKSAEALILEKMNVNLKKMEEEREFARKTHKGNYTICEHVADVYKAGKENVDFVGYIYRGETKPTKSGKWCLSGEIADLTSGIAFRAYSNNTSLTQEFLKSITPDEKKHNRFLVRMRGAVSTDRYSGNPEIFVHFIDQLPPEPMREDPEEEKRVELHLHTNMSAMDGLPEPIDYAKLAKNMGMKAMAITDHGVLQSFPAGQSAGLKTGIKIIYGCEFYMVDLEQKVIDNVCDRGLLNATYCVFDTETTGLSAKYDRMTEFGALLIKNGQEIGRIDFFCNPGMKIPEKIVAKTRITDEMVKDGADDVEANRKITEFAKDAIFVSHNADFDMGFLNSMRERLGLEPFSNPVIDTLGLSRIMFPDSPSHRLGRLSKNLGLDTYNDDDAHRADFDAGALVYVWNAILARLSENNPNITHRDLSLLKADEEKLCKHLRAKHVVALAKNEKGLAALYKLVTDGHLKYLARVPLIPRTVLNENRENLLLGSACSNGEVFDTAQTRGMDALKKACSFYDYIEVQPIENYSFLVNSGDVSSKDYVLQLLRDIISAADSIGKPVVATGDCHYVNPEDKILRDVYINSLGIGNGRHPLNPIWRDKMPRFENPDVHFRSTKEMLDSFIPWLGEERSREIIIKNTNMIADQIEVFYPVKKDTYAPNANLPQSADEIRKLCESNLKKFYGENPDPFIRKRLDDELNGIIGAGYSVTYYIAYRIIKKATDDGYIVGSRGSVGSSFAATMAEITEVNPLPPHWRCPKCKHLDWGKDYAPGVLSGFDLPERNCPECGSKMIADGQNIPFQTFLGFNADKVPDIDLNFPNDYQAKAHDYTRVLLGANNVFRAGTIATVAAKTAFGYVRKFFETNGRNPDEIPAAYVGYLSFLCMGVKRTTGQHPGGIVVIPSDHDKFEFTAIQHPADDKEADWLTTHYEFASLHDELLKLDLLGHVDPMAMRLMSLMAKVNYHDIPMNDPKVISLFTSPAELHLSHNYLGSKTGTTAVPEFGTDLAQRMLETAQPKCFNDLLIMSGLAHGTDVWANNAEDLILSKTATLQQVIGCRDDIMSYLISMGMDSTESFKIMEDVRHGKGLKKEYEADMREHNVPDFYITSCNKIAYLFPRAHATAYVQMAVRVAYFKLYYPLVFYAVFFSVRCDDWDIKTMIEGEDAIIAWLDDYKVRFSGRGAEKPKPKDKNLYSTLQIALEMLERGYHFEKIDIMKSDATIFQVDEANKALIPPFSVIDGLGAAAAESVVEARKDGAFLSQEDLLKRTKLNGTNVEDLKKLGALGDLGETNQMSLFEFM